jgi:hypothetical protein
MAITVYFTPIDATRSINIDRKAVIWTHNKGTAIQITDQPINAPHSGVRMDPDIYFGVPSGN